VTVVKQFAKTTTELAEALEITRQALYKSWLEKEGFPMKTGRGWDVAACSKFIQDYKEIQKEEVTGANADLKRRKLELECKMYQVKIDQIEDRLIPLEEYHADLLEFCGVLAGALEEFVQWVMVETRDAAQVEKAKELRDRVKRWTTEAVQRRGECASQQ